MLQYDSKKEDKTMKKLKMFLSIILIAALCLMPEFDIFAKSAGNKSFGQVVESGVAANLDKSQ